MIIIGIDLAGPANITDTAISVFRLEGESLALLECPDNGSDATIFGLVERYPSEDFVFGLDSPLSYNPGGGYRPSDAELRRLVDQTGANVGVMAPTLNRMCYLTLRGIHIAHTLNQKPSVRVVEVHPTASMALRGADPGILRTIRESEDSRQALFRWLSEHGLQGVDIITNSSDHLVASFACAFTSWQWALNQHVWKYPKQPPHFPFDFVC